MSMFSLAISFLATSNSPWFMDPHIPGSYAILLFTVMDSASITSHIHSWVLFLLWLCLFIFSGVSSPLISSSILGTYLPGEFVFQCPISLPFHTVHGVLKARMLKWFVNSFSSGLCFVRTLHHNLSDLGGPICHGSEFHWAMKGSWVSLSPPTYPGRALKTPVMKLSSSSPKCSTLVYWIFWAEGI